MPRDKAAGYEKQIKTTELGQVRSRLGADALAVLIAIASIEGGQGHILVDVLFPGVPTPRWPAAC